MLVTLSSPFPGERGKQKQFYSNWERFCSLAFLIHKQENTQNLVDLHFTRHWNYSLGVGLQMFSFVNWQTAERLKTVLHYPIYLTQQVSSWFINASQCIWFLSFWQAWELYEKGELLKLVDPELEGPYPEEEVLRYMKVAFFCTQSAMNRRPLMSQVVEMLSKNIRLNEKELTAPGFFQDSTRSSGPSSSKKSSTDSSYMMSSAPITITQVTPRWRGPVLLRIEEDLRRACPMCQ